MPKIITIIFECFPPYEKSMYEDPSRIDESERCVDAFDDLEELLHDINKSYYYRGVTRDEMHAEEKRLYELDATEFA